MRENVRDLMKKNAYESTPGGNQYDSSIGNSFKQSFLNTNSRTPPSNNIDPFLNDLIKPSNNQNLLRSNTPSNSNEPLRPIGQNRGGYSDFGPTNGLQNFNSPSFRNPTPQFGGGGSPPTNISMNPEQNIYNTNKFQRSKMECIEQLTQILQQLDRKESMLKSNYVSHNDQAFQKFLNDYDNLARQITTYVYEQLQEQKKRMIQQLKNRRSGDYVESKPILKNIQSLRNQITTLRSGLARDQEYRRYIVETVPRDFEVDLNRIQTNINSLRFPNVELWIDQKHFQRVKKDLDRIILARDELSTVMHKIIQQSKSQDNIRTLNTRNPFGNNPNRGGSFFDFIFR